MQIRVTVNNSHCQVEGLTPELEKKMRSELRYLNQNIAYTYHSNLRQIERIRSKLSPRSRINLSEAVRSDLEVQLRSLEGRNRGLFRQLYRVLFKDGQFPTGLLPKFLAILTGSNAEHEVVDLRVKPSQKQIKHVLRESFPAMRYYQRAMSRIVLDKGRGIGVAPTGCHAKGQKILMYDGTLKKVEEVIVGDQLMGPDSKPRNVLQICRGRQTMVRIVPVKGEPFVVNLDHILSLKRTNEGDNSKDGEIVNIRVRDYLAKSTTFKHLHKLYRTSVQMPEEDLPVDEYWLGTWLGDGEKGSVAIYTPDAEIKNFWIRMAHLEGLTYNVVKHEGCERVSLIKKEGKHNTLKNKLRSLNLINNKHIPLLYKKGSIRQRLRMIAGLIDTDGSLSNGGYDWISVSEEMANDMAFLCRSVGLAAYVSKHYKTCQTGNGGWYFRVSISGDCSIIPCKVARKRALKRKQKKSVLVTGFTVEYLPEDDYYGFTLDTDHLYLLNDFTVTHNTGKTLTIARMIWELGVKTLVITPNKSITDNMVDTLVKHFGKGKVSKLSTKMTKTNDINVCNIQALIKMNPELFNDLDCVIIDEFHHASAATYQEVNEKHLRNCYYRIGMTATNFRNDGSDLALEAVLSEVLYEYTIKQAIADGFLIRPKFHIEETSLEARSTYQKEYKEGIVENEERNDLIAQIAEHHAADSVIILVQQIEHGEKLKDMIPSATFLHGDEKDSVRVNVMNDYRKGKIKCLIGTSVIGEGVDLPRASILILAGGGKAKSAVMQNVGRVLRPFEGKTTAIVYDFTDTGSSYLEEHSKLRQEIYQQYEKEGS